MPDEETPKNPLGFRNPTLVVALVGYVADADAPVPWIELLDTFADAAVWKTIENVLYELVAFGALHRVGKPATRNRRDSRALKLSTLGRAWLDRELLPLPTDHEDDDELDPHELAEQIAEAALHEAGLDDLDPEPEHTLAPGTEPPSPEPPPGPA